MTRNTVFFKRKALKSDTTTNHNEQQKLTLEREQNPVPRVAIIFRMTSFKKRQRNKKM